MSRKRIAVEEAPDGEFMLHWRMTKKQAEEFIALVVRLNAFSGDEEWSYKLFCALDDAKVEHYNYRLIHDGGNDVDGLLNFRKLGG